MTNTTTTNPKFEEVILVTPRDTLFDNERLTFQGVVQDDETINEIVSNLSSNLYSMRRGGLTDPTPKENNAEINTDLKQPIPYAILTRGNQVYVYERLSGGGESRLHGKLSIGIGGHQNPEEGDIYQQIMINLERELEEELDIQSSTRDLTFIGLINDDADEVGRVHLGILATVKLADDATVEVRETEQLRGFWLTLDELKEESTFARLENWSKIAVEVM